MGTLDTGSGLPGEPHSLDTPDLDVEVITQPAWSPDGKWIAFAAGDSSGLRIFAVLAEGGQPKLLTATDSNALMPSWSPDGRWLFYSSDRGGQVNLWKAAFEEGRLGNPTQVTAGSGADLRARVDPRGKRIVYSSVSNASDVWEYDLESGHAKRLTMETTLEEFASPSPDGRFLAFSSNRLGGNHLWLLNRETGTLAQVTTKSNPSIFISSYWSSDGNSLFYYSGDAIWRYELATGSSRKVHEEVAAGAPFCVSPDGRYLVVISDGPFGRILRAEVASGKSTVLVQPAEGEAGDPACSTDGRWVAYQVQQGNERTIWLVALAGGEPEQLTFGG
jgi:Tol biopolymer transport system component